MAVSLSTQCENSNGDNIVPSIYGNMSLPAPTTNISFVSKDTDVDCLEKVYTVEVNSRGKTWVVKRNVENFRLLDQQCHQCVYDRKYSQLPEIPLAENVEPSVSLNKHTANSYQVGNNVCISME